MSAINRLNISDFHCPEHRYFTFLSLFILLAHHLCTPKAISFNYPDFSDPQNLNFTGDAFSSNGIISLTRDHAGSDLTGSVGRVPYAKEIQLWKHSTGEVADFTTHFSFTIKMLNPPTGGDGLTFFLTPNGTHIPDNSAGGCLGLISNCEDFNPASVVALEIDTFKNVFDPSDNHIGIDVNSIKSVTNITWGASLKNGTRGHIWFSYDYAKKELTAYLTFLDNPVYDGGVTLSYGIDLTKILPEWVTIGFSGSTGAAIELQQIHSWEFHSTNFSSSSKSSSGPLCFHSSFSKCWGGWVIIIVISIIVMLCVLAFLYYLCTGKNPCTVENAKALLELCTLMFRCITACMKCLL